MNANSVDLHNRRSNGLATLAVALTAAALLITAGGNAWGGRGMWALGFVAYVPLAVRWLAAALIVLSAMPFTYGWWRMLRRLAIPWWVALPGALTLFWLFRERTWHGDALYKVELLATHTLQNNPYVWKEPLNSLLEYGMSRLLQPFGIAAEGAIAGISVAAGVLFVQMTWAAASWLTDSALRRLVLYTALFASGTSLLWFGHVENYSGSTALAFATIVLALGALRGHVGLWAVAVTGGAAVSFHPQAAFVLPALLLLLRRRIWLRQVATLVVGGAVVPLLTVAVFWALKVPLPNMEGGFAGDPQLFWTPAQALAPGQLADAFQNLWLVAPLWPLWIGAGIGGFAQLPLRCERAFLLLATSTAGVLLYFFTFQNDLARQRDWDLFAIAGPPLTLWGMYAWFRLLDGTSARRAVTATLRQILASALLAAASFSIFWIGVNHAYMLVRPNAAERTHYARYQLQDLTALLPQATIIPATPICPEASGCERVALTEFTMPQNGDTRPVIFAHAPVEIALPLVVPAERSFLWLSPALDPQAWDWGGDGVTFIVKVRTADGEQTVWSRHITPADPAGRQWHQVFVPLDDYRGEAVTLILATDPGQAGDEAADRSGWGMPWLMRGTVASE